ncbi:UxaA family hydrolase [Gudongella sp. DL1XJH-153]|uniref:UxaA family hydrolase n=1 Tax=Gudongella sp. DL1XJH-153 TaxID=3409804 RepID=UPI003BB4B139
MFRRILILKPKDSVAVLLEEGNTGDSITLENSDIELLEPISFAHKVSIVDLKKNDPVYKYGVQIGYALEDIPKGSWIHGHNMGCDRGKVRREDNNEV